MRVAFLGSPPFAAPVVRSLFESEHTPCALVTRPDRARGRGRRVQVSPLVELANERGVPVLQPESARDPEFRAQLAALEPELLLVASFGQILDQPLLELAPRGAYNVHASLLPRHRGASPIQAAILAGDAETGVSVQRIVLALDEGDVLLEKRTPIGPDETAGELLERLSELGAQAALEALDRLAEGEPELTPQDPALATYARKLAKDAGDVDWRRPATELVRHVRAMTPWPGARATLADGRRLSITRARAVELDPAAAEQDAAAAEPGTLLRVDEACVVATGDGALELQELTPAGKRPMPAHDWLRGARLELGDRFEVPA